MAVSAKKEKKEEFKQLNLDIKEPFSNKYFKIKGAFDRKIISLEVLKFLKDPLLWAVIVIGGIFTLHQAYMIYSNYSSLPTLLPILKYFITPKEQLASKDLLYIYPSISGVSIILTLILTPKYYNRERNFVKLLMTCCLLCCIAQSIILIDLIS